MKKLTAFLALIMLAVFVISACTPDLSESTANSIVESIANSNVSKAPTESTANSSQTSESNVTSQPAESTDNTSKSADTTSKIETPRPDESDIEGLVNWYYDIIFATKQDDKFEFEIADAFPDEFSTLVALGEKAFPVLNVIIENKDINLIKRAFAHYIKYNIKPELYDLSFSSPDGKYSIDCSVHNFITTMLMSGGNVLYWLQYDNVRLVDKTSNKVILTTNITDSNIYVKWRSDSKYAAISYGYDRYYTITDVFDIKNNKLITLPTFEKVGEKLGVELTFSEYKNIRFRFKEWLPDNKVKIEILARSTTFSDSEGWFIFDLAQQKIESCDIKVID